MATRPTPFDFSEFAISRAEYGFKVTDGDGDLLGWNPSGYHGAQYEMTYNGTIKPLTFPTVSAAREALGQYAARITDENWEVFSEQMAEETAERYWEEGPYRPLDPREEAMEAMDQGLRF